MRGAMTVLAVDDHALVRAGLVRMLGDDPRITIVGDVGSGSEAVRACLRLRPDVVLMDVQMPGMDGIAATREIVNLGLGTVVLILTAFDTDEQVLDCLRAGASGYLLKDAAPDALVGAIIAAASGERVLAGQAAHRLLEAAAMPRPVSLEILTPREREIFELVAAGATTRVMASTLSVSEKTVRNHLSHLYGKLNVKSRAQALLLAVNSDRTPPQAPDDVPHLVRNENPVREGVR